MNTLLADAMKKGVRNATLETERGFCLRAVRQAAERVVGKKYDKMFRGDGTARDATAARAGHRFLAAGLGFKKSELQNRGGLQLGDMLVKTEVAPNRWGDFSGHIGILVEPDLVAENSSTSLGRVHGALGYRSLSEFGDFQIVVRLPDPNASAKPPTPDKFFLQGIRQVELKGARVEDGKLVAAVGDVAHALGFNLTTRNDRRATEGRFDVRAETE